MDPTSIKTAPTPRSQKGSKKGQGSKAKKKTVALLAAPMSLRIEGAAKGKARPRAVGHVTMDAEYRAWKDRAINSLKAQIAGMRIEGTEIQLPVGQVRLAVLLHGKHDLGVDSDNGSGSIMDALVQAGILVGDTLKQQPSLLATLVPRLDDRGKPVILEPWIQIYLYPAQNSCSAWLRHMADLVDTQAQPPGIQPVQPNFL